MKCKGCRLHALSPCFFFAPSAPLPPNLTCFVYSSLPPFLLTVTDLEPPPSLKPTLLFHAPFLSMHIPPPPPDNLQRSQREAEKKNPSNRIVRKSKMQKFLLPLNKQPRKSRSLFLILKMCSFLYISCLFTLRDITIKMI